MKHKITLSCAVRGCGIREKNMIKRAVESALDAEKIDVPCEINVLIVDDKAIKELNARFRDRDAATDVLSFPMLDLNAGEKPIEQDVELSTGYCPLGDIVISLEHARAQGEEYGHGLKRELSYLAVHSVLHLLGYDHIDEGEQKAVMRRHEEQALKEIL